MGQVYVARSLSPHPGSIRKTEELDAVDDGVLEMYPCLPGRPLNPACVSARREGSGRHIMVELERLIQPNASNHDMMHQGFLNLIRLEFPCDHVGMCIGAGPEPVREHDPQLALSWRGAFDAQYSCIRDQQWLLLREALGVDRRDHIDHAGLNV